MRVFRILLFLFILALVFDDPAAAQRRRKKKEEEVTQVLEVLKDPPLAMPAETRRLVFFASPLSGKGLLSQQVRDALKALSRQAGSAQIVRLRAFTAGTGDLRRVQAIVSETFTDKRQSIPALTVVQAGALPLEGAQVVIEAAAVARKPVNPNGLAWLSGAGAVDKDPAAPVAPLLEKSIVAVEAAAAKAGAGGKDVLRVACFVSSLDRYSELQSKLLAAFPAASIVTVQAQRSHSSSIAECEAVARLSRPPSAPLEFVGSSEGASQIALVNAERVLFATAKIAFRYEDEDLRLAFDRMKRTLAAENASMSGVAFAGLYPLSGGISERIRKIRSEFFDTARPPATTVVLFEALPSVDASFALDVIAIK